ncbi:MAG: DUF4347 domain-containing protein [Cyanobacteria bacterium P01_C01_bin.89]
MVQNTALLKTPTAIAADQGSFSARHLIFVDANVDNRQSLLANVPAGAEVVVLQDNGIGQITKAIQAETTPVGSIHIFSHGKPGQLFLGNGVLSAATLSQVAPQLQSWREFLAADADILFYGCEVAATEAGEAFLGRIHELTGASIAASKTLTGSPALGGDAELAFRLGDVRTASINTEQYEGVLVPPSILSIQSSAADGTYGPGGTIPITINFNEPVDITTDLTLTLDSGGTVVIPAASVNNNTFTATYTVPGGATTITDGIDVTGVTGTVVSVRTTGPQETANTFTVPTVAGPDNISGAINVDATTPVISTITTTATNPSTLGPTNPIPVTITFDGPKTLAGGNLDVTLNSGEVINIAPFTNQTSVSGTVNVGATGTGTTVPNLSVASVVVGAGATLSDVFASTTLANPVLANPLAAGANVPITTNIPTGVGVDKTAPVAPSVPDLADASDTGQLNNDQVTNDTTPTFTGTAEAGATVQLRVGGTNIAGATAVADAGGAWSITVPTALAPGAALQFDAIATDAAGNVGPDSGDLAVNLDTAAPLAPGAPNLQAASDSAVNTDNVTNVANPIFDVTTNVAATDTVELLNGSTVVGTVVSGGATANVTATGIAEGTYSLTARVTDLAGNVGPVGAALNPVVIDRTAPTPTITLAGGQADPTTVADPVNFTVTFDEPVVGFDAADTAATQTNLGGVPADAVTGAGPAFNVAITGVTGTANNGTVTLTPIAAAVATDVAGNPSLASVNTDNVVAIDNQGPAVTDVSVAPTTGLLGIGGTAALTVTFDEAPILSAGAVLSLPIDLDTATGVNPRLVPLTIAGTTATGTYTVAAGDVEDDLKSAAALVLTGGTLRDAAGNDANLALATGNGDAAALENASNTVVIDGTAPTVTNIDSTNGAGTLAVGGTANITVTFSDNVTLSTGGTLTATVDASSTPVPLTVAGNTATGTYTVAAGDASPDLNVTALNLTGTLTETTSGNAVSNIATIPTTGAGSFIQNEAIVIDGVVPTIQTVAPPTTQANPAGDGPLVFNVTFTGIDDDLTGVLPGAITPVARETTTGSPAFVAPAVTATNAGDADNNTYQVTLTGGNLNLFSGTVGLNFLNTDLDDVAGNDATVVALTPPVANTGTAATETTVAVDNIGPTAVSITRKVPTDAVTSAPTGVVFQVVLSERASGLTAADFAVSGTTATVTQVNPLDPTTVGANTFATTYDVVVQGGDIATIDGATVGLNFAATSAVTDVLGTASTTPIAEPATDETFTIQANAGVGAFLPPPAPAPAPPLTPTPVPTPTPTPSAAPTLVVPSEPSVPSPLPTVIPGATDGNDILAGDAGANGAQGADGADDIDGFGGNDVLEGNAGDDTVNGGMGDDFAAGSPGDDVVSGDAGNDTVTGNEGNDILNGDGSAPMPGDDLIFGGAGNDTAFGGQGADTIAGGIGSDQVFAGQGDDLVFGEDGDDLLSGDVGNDTIDGGAGNDTLIGDSLIETSDSADVLIGGTGNDLLFGQRGNDSLFGGDDNDILLGGRGDDTLFGDSGDDTLNGNLGSDVLTGGDGADIFQIGQDSVVITDFVDGTDRLQAVNGVTVASLSFAVSGGNTVITTTGGVTIATLNGVTSGVDTADFV